jgi:hypothetical protein
VDDKTINQGNSEAIVITFHKLIRPWDLGCQTHPLDPNMVLSDITAEHTDKWIATTIAHP